MRLDHLLSREIAEAEMWKLILGRSVEETKVEATERAGNRPASMNSANWNIPDSLEGLRPAGSGESHAVRRD